MKKHSNSKQIKYYIKKETEMKENKPINIAKNIDWVGVTNPDLKRFDVIMETEYGTSYNAYIVKGSEKTALIDCVRDGYLEDSLEKIAQIVDPTTIDYIVVQHTEPDHSGCVEAISAQAPGAQIVCTKAASQYLPFIANRELPITVVKEGDELDLGDIKLKFIVAPFLHWPDTMFTYEEKSGCLFTCDAFGCHYSSEKVLESLTDPEFKKARRHYYDCIVSPFAPYVLKAIKHVSELNLPNISAILPSHGPVLDKDPMEAVTIYEQWSKEVVPEKDTVFIGYVSSYGYTAKLAQELREELERNGKKVDIADLAEISAEEATQRIMKASALAIGSPTINQDAIPPIIVALAHVSIPIVRGRKAIVFGTYGWSGEGITEAENRVKKLGYKVLGTMKARFNPGEEELAQIRELGKTLAQGM